MNITKYKSTIGTVILCLISVSGNIGQAQAQPGGDESSVVNARKIMEAADVLRSETTQASLQKAISAYEEAAKIFSNGKDFIGEATALSRIGYSYTQLDESKKALENFERAAKILESPDNKIECPNTRAIERNEDVTGQQGTTSVFINNPSCFSLSSIVYQNIGFVQKNLGNYREAEQAFLKALEYEKAESDKAGDAFVRVHLVEIYFLLGDESRADKILGEIIESKLNLRTGNLAYPAYNVGVVYQNQGKYDKALRQFEKALKIWEYRPRSKDVVREIAQTHNKIGEVYFALNQLGMALSHFDWALSNLKLANDNTVKALVLTNKAITLGTGEKAVAAFQEALIIYRKLNSLRGESEVNSRLQKYFQIKNKPSIAIIYGKQAVNIFQEIRTNIQSFSLETQKKFLASKEKTYRLLADILIAEGRIAEAEEVLAMLKDEEFFAYLRRADKVAAELKGKISLSADERKAFEDYEKFADEITRTSAEFGVLEKKMNDLPQGAKLSAADQAEYERLKKNYDAAVTVFGKFLDDLKNKFGTADKRVATVESNTQNILRELKQPRTVIISTIAGEDRLNLIVTTTDIQRAHTVEIKSADLNELVTDFRAAVKNPSIDPRPLGKKLYDTLFPAALQKDLENIKADTIVWSLDGSLRYAPMAALWDGKNYLAERYTNAVLTLAVLGNLNAPQTDRAKWQALGVGVSKAFQNFPELPAVPQELCSVVSDPQKKTFCQNSGATRTGVIKGLMLSDEEFTLQTFQNELGKVPVVHIASHFSLNAGDESDSFLLLGGGAERRFSLVDMKKKRLDKVELLTLSACNTAMTSGNNSNGVEIEGFGALAQQQGAKSVLATLWAVADDLTRDLMTEFYAEFEKNPSSGKAEALRKAQLKLINGKYKSEDAAKKRRSEIINSEKTADNLPKYTKDENAPFAHPYFWSPFILFGNWK